MRGEGPSRKEVMENAKPKLGGKARQRGKLHLGRPSNGTQYAKMAVVQLEKISPNDTQRAAAFDVVVDWIEKAKSAPAEERQPEVTTDADGRDIPSHLEEVFGIQEQFEQFAQTLSTLKGQVRQAIETNPVAWSQFSENAFRAAIEKARDLLTMSGPFRNRGRRGHCRHEKGPDLLER
jgi:hypothetical protein